MSLGVAIGAVTPTGSVIAFAKLSGRMSGKPILLPARHLQPGAGRAAGAADRLVLPVGRRPAVLGHHADGPGVQHPHHRADRRRRQPVVISMLNSYSGWAPPASASRSATSLIVTGALVGSSGAILSCHVQGHERSLMSVILGGFGETAASGRRAGTRPSSWVRRGPPSS
jgi:NAD(P) transhydrogenase subunit beta